MFSVQQEDRDREGIPCMNNAIDKWIIDFVDDIETGKINKMILRNFGTGEYADEQTMLSNFDHHISDLLRLDRETKEHNDGQDSVERFF